MIITKLTITAFGGIKNKTIELSSGLNVIYGLNESGKSTVSSFIYAMLYGMNKPQKSDNRVNLRQKYLPWDTQEALGSMEFLHNGEKYIIERKFGKTKRSDKAVLRLADTWEECTDIDADNLGYEMLGLTEESFSKTVYMGQLLTRVSGKDDEIIKKLSNLSSTGDEEASFGKIKDALLLAKYSIIPKQSAKSIMGDLKEEKERLEKEKCDISYANDAVKESIYKNNLLLNERESIKNELTHLASEREQARQYEKFLADKKIIENNEMLTKRAEKLAEEIEANSNIFSKNEEELSHFLPYEELKSAINKIESLEKKAQDDENLRLKISVEESNLNNKENELHFEKKRGLVSFSILLLFAIFFLVGAIASVLFKNNVLAFLSTFVAIMLLFLSIIFYKKTKSVSKLILNEISLSKKRIDELRLMITENPESEINSILFSYGVKTKDEFYKLLDIVGRLKDDNAKISSELSFMKKKLEEIEFDIAQNEKSITGQAECEQTRSFEEVDKEYSNLNERLLELEKEKKELELKISHLTEGKRSLDVVLSELSLLEPKITYYNGIYNSLEIAISVLSECEEELKSGFTPELISYVSDYLTRFTDGRYNEIRLSDNYDVKIKEPEFSSVTEAENLSGGTLDLVYIAVRLGILNAIFGGNIPMLVMDDTFLQLDDERQNKLIRVLFDNTCVLQTFYFTCHKDVVEKIKKFSFDNMIYL